MPLVAAVLGDGSAANRKILPAQHAAGFALAGIGSRTKTRPGVPAYEALLDEGGGLAWIANHNAGHFESAYLALSRGWHVIVEKPMGLSAAEAESLCAMAEARDLLCAEALPWLFHPAIRDLPPHSPSASMVFTFPSLPPDNFRWRHTLGGGAVNDLGPYVVSAIRRVLGIHPTFADFRVSAKVATDELVTMFHLESPSFSARVGWGDGVLYRNRLVVQDEGGGHTEIMPAFTVPDASGYLAFAQAIKPALAPDASDMRAAWRETAVKDAESLDALRRLVEAA